MKIKTTVRWRILLYMSLMMFTLFLFVRMCYRLPAYVDPKRDTLTIQLDTDTGASYAGDLTYQYETRTLDRTTRIGGMEWTEDHDVQGSVELSLPARDCLLIFSVRGPDMLWGKQSKTFRIRNGNEPDAYRMKILLGASIQGIVRDAISKKPVQGARVSPAVFSSPIVVPDTSRSEFTDRNGYFHVRGVDRDLGIILTHPNYLTESMENLGEGPQLLQIGMTEGATITGRVFDGTRPLQDVLVRDFEEDRETITRADGGFVLKGVGKEKNSGEYSLGFFKDKYEDRFVRIPSIPQNGLHIDMKP